MGAGAEDSTEIYFVRYPRYLGKETRAQRFYSLVVRNKNTFHNLLSANLKKQKQNLSSCIYFGFAVVAYVFGQTKLMWVLRIIPS